MPNSSGAEESDQQREAEAYNYNIYLMVGTPYTCLAVVGFLVYRNLKRRSALQATFLLDEANAPASADLRLASGKNGGD